MKAINLTDKEALKLSIKIKKLAKQVIVFTEIRYLETKTFNEGDSVYHIFGVFNEAFNCWNKVTYSPTSKSLEFSLWTVETNF